MDYSLNVFISSMTLDDTKYHQSSWRINTETCDWKLLIKKNSSGGRKRQMLTKIYWIQCRKSLIYKHFSDDFSYCDFVIFVFCLNVSKRNTNWYDDANRQFVSPFCYLHFISQYDVDDIMLRALLS